MKRSTIYILILVLLSINVVLFLPFFTYANTAIEEYYGICFHMAVVHGAGQGDDCETCYSACNDMGGLFEYGVEFEKIGAFYHITGANCYCHLESGLNLTTVKINDYRIVNVEKYNTTVVSEKKILQEWP